MIKKLLFSVVIATCLMTTTAHANEVILADAPFEDDSLTTVKVENKNPYTGIVEAMTDEEADILNRIVAAESQTQSLEGRKAVVEVIFNRVLSDKFPNSVKDVLSQKGQFSTWRMRNQKWVIPELGADAVSEVARETELVLPDTDYLYFSRGKQKYATDYLKIENHWFGRAK